MSTTIPAEHQGTWDIDASHSDLSFTVRHMGVSNVRGVFSDVTGTITTGETPEASRVSARVKVASVNTNDEKRDEHLRTSDFFDAENHPEFTFESTEVVLKDEESGVIRGDLTMRGVTRPVEFDVEFTEVGEDPWGNQRFGVTGSTSIDRTEFGIDWNAPLEKTGGMLVSKKVKIELSVSAVLRSGE